MKSSYFYKLGMYLGRFQPFHNGHMSIVNKMLEECERIVIVIGSSDKKGTVTNPFPAWERAMMIKTIFPCDRVDIVCIPDRPSIKSDDSWGEYVIEHLRNYGYMPDAIYQGFETERTSWWRSFPDICVESVSRLDIPISATLIRAAIVEGREEFIREYCPYAVAEHIINSMYWGRDFHE